MQRTEPGVGDPPGFRLEECATAAQPFGGRAATQAVAIGRVLAERRIRGRSRRVESLVPLPRHRAPRVSGAQVVQSVESLNSFFEDRSTVADADARAACAHRSVARSGSAGAGHSPGQYQLPSRSQPGRDGRRRCVLPARWSEPAGDRSVASDCAAMRRALDSGCAHRRWPEHRRQISAGMAFARWRRSVPAGRSR